jgi:TetR/AcrR family transcriptional repressor of nem operon
MGYSRADKAQSHERIVQTAAVRFREKGIDGISVADLMKEAGLTHGGFYRHFESRDDLVAQAVETALKAGNGAIEQGLEGKSEACGLAAYIGTYLSEGHRDNPGEGCAVTALAGDVARSGAPARELYAQHVARSVERLSELMPTVLSESERRANALVIITTLAGALSVARATGDAGMSSEILMTVRERLVREFAAEG